jgi:hypothetical protein
LPPRADAPQPASENVADWRISWAPLIARITAAYLAAGGLALLAWQVTGNPDWAVEFFQVPAAILMVCLALTEFWLSSLAIGQFSSDDLLRPGWTLIACSAGCQLVGMVCSQVLGVPSRINPLVLAGSPESLIPLLRNFGLLAGGTFRFAFLAAGLAFALKAYKQSSLGGRLGWAGRAVLAGFGIFVLRNVTDVARAIHGGKTPGIWEVLGWPVDPLLWLLLLQALLLWGATRQMGRGRIGLCWKAFSAGVFLTALGDIGAWAYQYGYLPWPWNALTWYVWLPAAAACARAPAFQLEVIRNAPAAAGPFVCEVLKASEP